MSYVVKDSDNSRSVRASCCRSAVKITARSGVSTTKWGFWIETNQEPTGHMQNLQQNVQIAFWNSLGMERQVAFCN